MIRITPSLILADNEVQFSFIRSAGPGGQNVNKVSTAVLLRFNVNNSSLPEMVRERFVLLYGKKITAAGELIIKANSHRTQERNKQDAIERLVYYLQRATFIPKKRKKTKPSKASKERRFAPGVRQYCQSR
jgi:ribosome-associated protein